MANLNSGVALTRRSFGPLWKYIRDENIANIEWDSETLWIQYADRDRERVMDPEINEEYMIDFSRRVGNHAGMNFNKTDNTITAETDFLRITCVHPSFSLSGTTVCIRKSLPKLRFNTEMAIKQGYADAKTLQLLVNCVLAKENIIFGGTPSKGKTEAAKFFSSFIPENQKVVTIEDVREWHYKEINKGKSCIELKVMSDKVFEEALELALRLNPTWLMPAETRGRDVRFLLESWTNGIANMTTLHVNRVSAIPERIINMLGSDADRIAVTEQIYNNVGVGVLLDKITGPDGRIKHMITEVGFFYKENDENKLALVVEQGILYPDRLPAEIKKRIEFKSGAKDAFTCEAAFNHMVPIVGDGNDEMWEPYEVKKVELEETEENAENNEASTEEMEG